jgi:hypothetical protein
MGLQVLRSRSEPRQRRPESPWTLSSYSPDEAVKEGCEN